MHVMMSLRLLVSCILLACGQSPESASPLDQLYNGQNQTAVSSPTAKPSAEWLELLEAAIGKQPQDFQKIQWRANKEAGHDAVKLLAQTLLEEWPLSVSNVKLHRPRLVFKPEVDFEGLGAQLPAEVVAQAVIVKVRVNQHGLVESFEMVQPSRYEVINERVQEVLGQVRFRPARDESGFIEKDYFLTFRLHLR